MQRVPLSDFADAHGQKEAARLLGVSQGGLSKAIKVGRSIYVAEQPDGSYSAEEVRPFPHPKSKTNT